MPHYMCAPCRTRLYRAGGRPEAVGDLCPSCGALLEPVGELVDVVGFRSIVSRAVMPAAPVVDLAERRVLREAILVEAERDIERWLDQEGSFRAEAAARPLPPPTSDLV